MMFTNVFRIGGLQTVSWFELLPAEDASNVCRKPLESDDPTTRQLLTAHIQLQNEGHLSSWTLCSASQEKGRKVKLWLFLPGRHDVVRPTLEAGLKVVKHGVWHCPGNSTEVTAALCQALRNRFERALSAFAYVRFGGMFVKCKRYVANDSDFRNTLPSCEIMFTASEEAIFVYLRVRRRRMRPLAASDIRAVLTQHMNSSSVENPAVVVAPYGLTGWLTGCCPGDLVRQLTQSKLEMYKEYSIRNSFPQSTTRNAGFWSRSWYVEVRMKFLLARGTPSQHSKSQLKNEQIPEGSEWIEKVFIFPSEAVLVPTVPPVSARTYLKRCWLRKFAGTDWLEDAVSLRGFSPLTSLHGHRLQAMGKSNTIWKLNSKSSMSSTSSGSGGSSIKSSDSRGSSGSESDVNDDGEYKEDADSAATKAEKQGTLLSFSAQASDVHSKRVLGLSSLKRGREDSSYKSAKRSSPDRVSSAANNATFESNSGPGSKGPGSQAGTPWDWNEEVTMQNDADFFAEFGDFGDFFEGDALGFGEPPGTAESQMGMFSFDGEGSSTPGTLDTSDPMLLPILDFPMLEGFGQPEIMEKEQDPGVVEDVKCEADSPSVAVPASVSLVARYEAALLFDPDYAPVEIPINEGSSGTGESAYRPETRKLMPTSSAKYVYSAIPPPTPKLESLDRKKTETWHADVEEGRKRKELNDSSSLKYYDVSSSNAATRGKARATDFGQYQHSSLQTTLTQDWQHFKSPIGMLATDLECAMFQVQLHNVKGVAYCAHPSEPTKPPDSSYKDCVSDITDVSDACDNLLKKQPDRRKKVPERIAGDADDVSHDGPRTVEIGVWRPVGIPKPQKTSDNFRNDVQSLGPSMASAEVGAASENGDTSTQEMVDLIPLLVQQASSLNDISLNGEHGDGALAWLALHQKLSQESPSLDLASNMSDICDPSVAEVSPATVASILQSDMRQAMGVAFGDVNVAGPLSLADWCRGKAKGDSSHCDIYSGVGDSKEIVSSITGEPITPPQSTGGGLGISKVISLQDLDNHSSEYRRSSREAEDTSQRRMSLDAGNTDVEIQAGTLSSYAMFPVPTLLVGYQDDWLRTSPSSLRYWEKAPFEPYGYPKPVTYYVLCIGLDPLLCSAFDFFQQLSTVYEACKLGTHTPANVTAQTNTKRMMPGFVTVGFACKLKPTSSSPLNMANNYVTAMESGWDISEFRKSLRKACKSLPISGSIALEADHEHSPSTVVYVVSPTSEPSVILQTMLESCQGLAPVLSRTRKTSGRSGLEEGKQHIHPVAGFPIGRFALQVVTPETIMRLSSSPASGLDVLKELAFGVYNKLRRIPYRCRAEDVQSGASSKVRIGMQAPQSNTSLPGLWSSNRNSGVGLSVMDAGNLRWEQPWHAPRLLEDATAGHSSSFAQSPRLLYEPLFILADSCLLDHSMGHLVHSSKEKAGFGEEPTTVQQNSGRSLGLAETAVEGDSRTCSQRCTFHCCYSWTTNWQWLISVWTDARGELLDVNVFPVRSISEKDGSCKELSQLFAQIIQQGLQLISLAVQAGGNKAYNIVVARIGEFYQTEYQEWQRIFMAMGADESRTWSVQIRPENVDYHLSQQRSVHGLTSFPTSPGTSSSFTSRGMLSGLSKADHSMHNIGKSNQATQIDNFSHAFQWVHSVTLATISSDNSLQVLSLADSSAGGPSAATWSTNSTGNSSGLATGFGMAKTISLLNGAYLFVPAHGLRYLGSTDLIPCKGDMPALAQVVQSKGPVSPVASGYVISGSTAASRTELAHMSTEEEWPSTLHVGLVAHFSSSTRPSGRQEPGMRLGGNGLCDTAVKLSVGNKEYMAEARCVLEQLGAEMYGLSWLTVSPMYLHRRLALPFHCDVAQRLDKLLCYMNAEITH